MVALPSWSCLPFVLCRWCLVSLTCLLISACCLLTAACRLLTGLLMAACCLCCWCLMSATSADCGCFAIVVLSAICVVSLVSCVCRLSGGCVICDRLLLRMCLWVGPYPFRSCLSVCAHCVRHSWAWLVCCCLGFACWLLVAACRVRVVGC